MHHHHSRVSAIKSNNNKRSACWPKRVNNEPQRTANTNQPSATTGSMTLHGLSHQGLSSSNRLARTQRNKRDPDRRMPTTSTGVMIQHSTHGADADLTSNSRGPFKVFRRSPPPLYIEFVFLQCEECGGAGGKPSGGYRKKREEQVIGQVKQSPASTLTDEKWISFFLTAVGTRKPTRTHADCPQGGR